MTLAITVACQRNNNGPDECRNHNRKNKAHTELPPGDANVGLQQLNHGFGSPLALAAGLLWPTFCAGAVGLFATMLITSG